MERSRGLLQRFGALAVLKLAQGIGERVPIARERIDAGLVILLAVPREVVIKSGKGGANDEDGEGQQGGGDLPPAARASRAGAADADSQSKGE